CSSEILAAMTIRIWNTIITTNSTNSCHHSYLCLAPISRCRCLSGVRRAQWGDAVLRAHGAGQLGHIAVGTNKSNHIGLRGDGPQSQGSISTCGERGLAIRAERHTMYSVCITGEGAQ